MVGFADATAARVGAVCAEHLAVLAFGPASASKRHEIGIAVLRAVQAASSAAADVAFGVRCRTTAASTASAAAAASAVASPAASTSTASAPDGFMASPHPRALGNARLRLTRECRTPRPRHVLRQVSGTTRGEVSGHPSSPHIGKSAEKANASGGEVAALRARNYMYETRFRRYLNTRHAPSSRAPSSRASSFRFTARCTLSFHPSRRPASSTAPSTVPGRDR